MELLLSMSSPQFTKYYNSFLFDVTAALFKVCKTSLVNLSFAMFKGASAFVLDAGSAPCNVKSLDALKSPKYEEMCNGV